MHFSRDLGDTGDRQNDVGTSQCMAAASGKILTRLCSQLLGPCKGQCIVSCKIRLYLVPSMFDGCEIQALTSSS